MSYQNLADKIVNTGSASGAAIVRLRDSVIWAYTTGFQITYDEAAKLVEALKNPEADVASGFCVSNVGSNGVHFSRSSSSAETLETKNGETGLYCRASLLCLVVGYYKNKVQYEQCVRQVTSVAAHLREAGH
mmetsp:Transcript_9535/g.15629  ORF Transcript_9535/g.15629 Transcript_9535/m.15629 type:complete len:132 (-) Transcript_9535:599-994(-)|eukprot:CAMPEP_0184661986 /NCGR_PEP_ID=MMETSP0308-20130426/41072_1 /TAXON_ID=38269 /ORGANISM="Gloeochaete witrockiana, Strain SAG 46.84" /LENGTH=131 /DNA_ID=CAMNT_0027103685 /DNA_START=70 /DNA_END=465 /DNA_ORIENTATION=-